MIVVIIMNGDGRQREEEKKAIGKEGEREDIIIYNIQWILSWNNIQIILFWIRCH